MAKLGTIIKCANCGNKFKVECISDKYCCDECRKEAIAKSNLKYRIKKRKLKRKQVREQIKAMKEIKGGGQCSELQ